MTKFGSNTNQNSPNRSRRTFAGALGIVLAAPALMLSRHASASVAPPRTLRFDHTHTGEKLAIAYTACDRYLPAALQEISRFLRDFRTGEVHAIDPKLLDQLHQLATVTGSSAPFEVISGYRSAATNGILRSHSTGVASQSLHLEGRAIDIRLPNVGIADLRDAAISLRAGGVGFYPDSKFVHVDTGRLRRW
ncbi:MAG: YcbK family protein [Betaproteobacteria bacterium]